MRPSTSPESRIQKFGLTKSRNGCDTCKSRKVKCDETQPRCQRCTSTGRRCEYKVSTRSGYGTSSAESSSPLSVRLSVSRVNPSALRERRAFEYYFYRGALSIAGALDIKFWKDIVLQLSRSEPAIWDAVIAISALYENPYCSLDAVPGGSTKSEALGWYSRSMVSVRSLIEQNKTNEKIALVTCILYICIEVMQGHTKEALQLYEQGMNLIYELRAVSATSRASFSEDTIIPLFARMGTAALATTGTPVVKNPFALTDHWGFHGFFTVEAASAALSPLIRESILFIWEAGGYLIEIGSVTNVSADITTRQQNFLAQLEDWHQAFTRMADKYADNQPDPMCQSAMSTLRTFHAGIYIMLCTCLTQRQTTFDAFLGYFRIIVEHASRSLATSTRPDGFQVPFTFEVGVGHPLFFTTMNCRDPFLRREALELLRRVPQVQGFFQCAPRVALAEYYIKMEEERISGLMIRMSDMTSVSGQTTVLNDSLLDGSAEYGFKDISMDRLANYPTIEDLVTVEDDFHFSDDQVSIPERNRIRKLVVIHLNSRLSSFDGRGSSTSQPFLHFTRNRPNPVNRMWEEREYFLPLNDLSMDAIRRDKLLAGD